MKTKILLKLERIARLRLYSGMTDKSICDLLQISQSNFSQIILLDEYRELEKRLAAGEIQELDIALAGKKEELRSAFAPLVPAAMRALQDAVLQRRDLKTAIVAAREILSRDPEGTFASDQSQKGAPESLPTSLLGAAAAMAKSVAAATPTATVVQPLDKHVN